MARDLDSEKVQALPMFHALTDCDKVSCFVGQGKRTDVKCEKTLSVEAHIDLGSYSCWCHAHDREGRHLALWKSTATDIDTTPRKMLAKKSNFHLIQPTRVDLKQHVRRAIYQGGHVWYQTLVLSPALSSPIDWGWIKTSNMYEHHWKTLPEHSRPGGTLSHGNVRRIAPGSASTRSPGRYAQQRVLWLGSPLRTGLAKLRWRFRTVQDRSYIL